MADRIEAFLLGLGNALCATLVGYWVVRGEVPSGLIFLAAFCAFLAIAQAVRLGVLVTQPQDEEER